MANSTPLPAIARFDSETQLRTYLVNEAVEQYSSLFGKTVPYYSPYPYFSTQAGSTPSASPSFTDTANIRGGAVAKDFSQTNTQEQGVDEADLIETDGEYLYQVENQTLTIVDARNPGQLTVTDQESLADLGRIEGAYLYGDRLTVISSETFYPFYRSLNSFAPYPSYDYDPSVKITVFDVSDPTAIKLQESSELDGILLSSRAVEDKVYVVTQDGFGLPSPKTVPLPGKPLTGKPLPGQPRFDDSLSLDRSDGMSNSPGSLATSRLWYPPTPSNSRYETQDEYLKRIQGKELELSLPEFTTTDGQGKAVRGGLLNGATDIYRPLNAQPSQMASVSVFDVDDGQLGPDDSIGLPSGYQSDVYMSRDSLYLTRNDWWSGGQTGLLKVDLDSLDFVARGEVEGRSLNQFSLDEEDGYLRVATTEGSGTKSSNSLTVLEQQGQSLNAVGKVDNIAPGERIYSARFDGDYGFLVTFRQVDPFFTLDLRQPTEPKVAGELKLPGFSQYLQIIENEGRQQVLGVGRDADDTGRAKGLKLSLFDVENFSAPQEVDSYLFEGKYSSSEAQWDQQAVGYYAQFDTLAIPFSNSLGGQGLRVFDVDAQDGFEVVGDISHGEGRIRRSLTLGDNLYAISAEKVTVHDIKTLALIDEVSWSDYGSGPVRWQGDSRVLGGDLSGASIFSASEAIA